MPLARLTMASTSVAKGRSSSSTARNPCDGTAMKTMPAPSNASSNEAVAVEPVGQADSREVGGVLPRLGRWTTPARRDRAHSETGCDAPTSPATAVPHEPAPTTATRSLMVVSLRR